MLARPNKPGFLGMTAYQKLKEAALFLLSDYPGGIVPDEFIEIHAKCLETVEKRRAARVKRYAENPEKIKAAQAKRYAENPEKIKADSAKWAAENREKRNGQARARSAAKRQAA